MAMAPERPPVTVAVLSGEDRRRTKDLLGALGPQLRVGDNVVVLGAGRSSQHLGAWRERRANGAFERPRTLPRPADYVLLLDASSTPSSDLVAVLLEGASNGAAAVAPRSNFGTGDERCSEVPYGRADIGVKRAFLRDIGASLPHRFTPAATLGGPCLLLHRELALASDPLDILGTADGVSEALQRIRNAGAPLLVAENAFVDHPSGALKDVPVLVSAALIVKNEEHQLEACLRAASALADEVIVYDTGSTDGTVDLARRAGATVIEGYWDDDFARARNEALARCQGEWILWVDADEVLQCPHPSAVRSLLASSPSNLDAYLVPIDNLQGTEAGTVMTHPAARLFRRATCQWEGRLHEQVVTRRTKTLINIGTQDLTRITHRGYLQHALRERDKAQRNLKTAFGDLAGGSDLDLATRTLSLARSYMLAGRFDEGGELCDRVLQLALRPSTKRLALRALGDALLSRGRFDEALEVSNQIKELTAQPFHGYVVEGHARLGRGEPELALAAFDHVTVGRDDDGFEYAPSLVAVARAKALVALEQHDEAADVLLDVLRSADGIDLHIGNLVQLLQAAGRDVCEILHALRPERQIAFVPQIVQLPPSTADEVLEAWYGQDPESLPILAAAAQVALGLPIDRQLVWSARLRSAGLWASCPLILSSIDERNPAPERAIAAAVAFHSFGDERGRTAYHIAVLSTSSDQRGILLEQITAISPILAVESDNPSPTPTSPPPHAAKVFDAQEVLVISTRVAHLAAVACAATAADAGHRVTLVQPAPWQPAHNLLAPLGVSVRCWDEGPMPHSEAAFRSAARLYADRSYDSVILTGELAPLLDRFRQLFPIAKVVALDEDAAARVIGATRIWNDLTPISDTLRRGLLVVLDPSWHDTCEPDALTRDLDALIPEALRAHPLTIVSETDNDALRRHLPQAMIVAPMPNPIPWLVTATSVLVLTRENRSAWFRLAARCGTPMLTAELAASDATILTPARGDGAIPVERSAHEPSRASASSSLARSSADRALPFEATIPSGRDRRTYPRTSTSTDTIHWRGSVYSLDSLAQVNRELIRQLTSEYPWDIEVSTPEAAPLHGDAVERLRGVRVHHRSGPPEGGAIEIRHQWPPDFTPSRSRRLVLIQPWEFGAFPAEWIGPIRETVDELWVPTSWVRQCAIESGIAPTKVHVVPNGIDTVRFSARGPKYPLRTQKSVRFLFVGGCIQRKGIDVLLETYLTTFTRDDDVCLVVKPYGAGSVYRNMTLEDDLRRAAKGAGAEIEIIDGDLSLDEMAALYRSCTTLVHPYRGEGFGLPIGEAMASGIAVIATDGGACLDFCSESTGWLVSARKVATAVPEFTPSNTGWWWFEPSRRDLAAALRSVASDPCQAYRRGEAGRQSILNGFTTAHAAAAAAERINVLLEIDNQQPLVGQSAGSA